jgi:hypothetical protein
MKTLIISFLSIGFAKVFFGKDNFDFLDIMPRNFKIEERDLNPENWR